MVTIEQIKAARALLDWNQQDLARKSGISKNAINNLERGVANPRKDTLNAISKALEEAGVAFTEGPGVKLCGQLMRVEVFEGKDSVFRLFGDIIHTLKEAPDRELLVSGMNEREHLRADEKHFMEFIRKCAKYRIKSRILVKEGDSFFVEAVGHYRWVSAEIYTMIPYFVYGDKYAVLLMEAPGRVVIIENKAVSQAYRAQFKRLWENAKLPKVA